MQVYHNRAQQFQQTAKRLQKQYNTWAVIRLIVFFLGIGVALWLSDYGLMTTAIYIFAAIIGFGVFMRWHQDILNAQRYHEALTQINQNEVKYWQYEYADFEDGQAFTDATHPNSADLDLFGRFSLFQYINRAATSIGQQRLADYFTQITDYTTVQLRQQAVQELSPQLDWRQHFQALSQNVEDEPRAVHHLLHWLQSDDYFAQSSWLKITLWVFPILTLGALVGIFLGFPYQVFVTLFIGQLLLTRQFLERINEAHEQTAQAAKFLATYAKIIAHIEAASFEADYLKQLQRFFIHHNDNNATASQSLKQLGYIISQLNVRYNAFVMLFSGTLLWDLQWIHRLENWKQQTRTAVPEWINALAELETLQSLAALDYNHPNWNFPELDANAKGLAAKEIGHPLIHRAQRVSNDIDFPKLGHLKLVTGSNMAGKSTFLRTLGVNIILASMGAPVCAKHFRLPILEVYTSMRTQDALHESTSSFYAELKRLKTIIHAVETKSHVFYLLDEILKGTNSNDRHRGAKALILQLIQTQNIGVVATHDLELGDLAQNYSDRMENLCMEVEVENEALVFDYKLKKGVSKSFNATYLMKNMGIRIEEEE